MEYLLLFHCKSGFTKTPPYYVVVHCLPCLVCLGSKFIAIILSFGLTPRCNAWKIYVERTFHSRFSPNSILLFDLFIFQVFIHQFKTGHNRISHIPITNHHLCNLLQFDVLNYEAKRKNTFDQAVDIFSGCRGKTSERKHYCEQNFAVFHKQ